MHTASRYVVQVAYVSQTVTSLWRFSEINIENQKIKPETKFIIPKKKKKNSLHVVPCGKYKYMAPKTLAK